MLDTNLPKLVTCWSAALVLTLTTPALALFETVDWSRSSEAGATLHNRAEETYEALQDLSWV